MSFRRVLCLPLLAFLALVPIGGCGDDESPTDGGNGGGTNNTLSIPAGAYALNATIFTCGTQTEQESMVDTLIFCSSELQDDFFDFGCAVVRDGDNLSISCTRTRTVYTGCEETITIDIAGTVAGDHYELSGTITYSDNPAACWNGSYCDSLSLTLDRIGNAPTACTYADANTIALTVGGGPQAGSHTLEAFGQSDNSAGNIAFQFTGFSGATALAAAPRGIQGVYLSASTMYINPAQLPAVLAVTVASNGPEALSATGGPEAQISYDESDGSYYFVAESATSGTMTVQELTDDHIAGTMTMTLTGTQYTEENPGGQPAQRTVSGGFYVTDSQVTRAADGILQVGLRPAPSR